jgi:hypothetical protein
VIIVFFFAAWVAMPLFRSNIMKKELILLAVVSVSLTGCLQPTARSMGATLMPSPLTHRANPDSASQEISLAASGFYGHTGDAYNVENLNAGGGNVGVTYRLGGKLSPLFANVAVGAFGGSLRFGCDKNSNCDKNSSFDQKYADWLESDEGSKSYSFWNVQERILAGADFNIGYAIFGAAGGVQLFQGGSDYDDMREKLDDEGLVNSKDEKNGVGAVSSVWLGSYLGRHGQYGNLVAEMDIFYKGDIDDWTSSIKWTYTHPSGFFGGVAYGNLMELTLFAGKQFVF